jgi:hypothetical protein
MIPRNGTRVLPIDGFVLVAPGRAHAVVDVAGAPLELVHATARCPEVEHLAVLQLAFRFRQLRVRRTPVLTTSETNYNEGNIVVNSRV